MSTRTGSVSRRDSQRNRSPASADADREREREPPEQGEPLLAKLRLGLGDDQPAERLRALNELHRLHGRDEPPALAGRRELDDHLLVAVELGTAERASRKTCEPEALAGERRERRRSRARHPSRARASRPRTPAPSPLVGRAKRCRGVQGGEPDASRRSSSTDCWRVTSWKRRTASAIEASPKTRTTARNTAVRRNRSVPSMGFRVEPRGSTRRAVRRDLVADAPHGDDRRCIAELAPDLAHVDVDGARVPGERVAPHALEELVAREDDPAVVEQLPEEVELLRREPDLLVADVHLALARVDREVAVLELLGLGAPALGRRPAEDALHARDELTRVERLRHVVVGADLESDDLVDVLVTRREHEDRDVRGLANPPAELDAVAVRQVEVEDDERGSLPGERDQRGLRARGGLDRVAGVAQVRGDERRDRRLVLDDQDGVRRRHCTGLRLRARAARGGSARARSGAACRSAARRCSRCRRGSRRRGRPLEAGLAVEHDDASSDRGHGDPGAPGDDAVAAAEHPEAQAGAPVDDRARPDSLLVSFRPDTTAV